MTDLGPKLEPPEFERAADRPSGRSRAPEPSVGDWASAKEGIDQVGCVYTAQGFEFDDVGRIVGPDLIPPMSGAGPASVTLPYTPD